MARRHGHFNFQLPRHDPSTTTTSSSSSALSPSRRRRFGGGTSSGLLTSTPLKDVSGSSTAALTSTSHLIARGGDSRSPGSTSLSREITTSRTRTRREISSSSTSSVFSTSSASDSFSTTGERRRYSQRSSSDVFEDEKSREEERTSKSKDYSGESRNINKQDLITSSSRLNRFGLRENRSSGSSLSGNEFSTASSRVNRFGLRENRSSGSISPNLRLGPESSTSSTTALKSSSSSDLFELNMREDSGIIDCDVNSEGGKSPRTLSSHKSTSSESTCNSIDTETRRNRGRQLPYVRRKGAGGNGIGTHPAIKITVETCDVMEDMDDSGVHLEEPTSPGSERWSDQLTSPVKTQWTDDDLDAFVKQLSNPQHQVTRVRNSAGPLDSPRKTSFDLCRELKDRERVRAPLARSETDTSVSFGDLGSPTFEGPRPLGGKGDRAGGRGGLISGLSGLRLLKNRKLARSSHAKKHATSLATSASSLPAKVTEGNDVTPGSTVTFSCSSSPEEGSDAEHELDPLSPGVKDGAANGAAAGHAVKEPGKKRRFRKMLSRPLNRSQSAGCAKDVPEHAQFMEQQRSKEAEMVSERKSRASEGDIRAVRLPSDEIVPADEEDSPPTSRHQEEKRSGRIHKTKSADASMMASDEFGAISQQQPKSKSRNIAKKITKKMQFLRRRHTDSTLGEVGGEGEGARRLANINPADAREWSKSFESLLYDKMGLELFRGFLMSEHSDENIEFWIACQNYKMVKSSKQLTQLAHKIYNDYVAVQSRREVNLDSKTRNLTFDGVSSTPNRQTFDEAQRRVQALMEKDSYRRFLESELYHDLAAGNLQQHKS